MKSVFKKYKFNPDNPRYIKDVFKNYESLQYRLKFIQIIDDISKGDHQLIAMHEDKKTGRLYHTLTMLPKNLRSYLKLDGQTLIELDASNSQWWMLQKVGHILISKEFFNFFSLKNTKNLPFNINTYLHKPTTTTHTTPPPLYMCPTFLNKNKKKIKNELLTLENLLYKNEFRKLFSDAFKKQSINMSDGKIKMYLLKHILFSNPAEPYHNKLKIVKEFKSLFPYLSRVINDLKLHLLNENTLQPKQDKKYPNKSVRWKGLSILLSKMEADIFIKDMATETGVFIPIHDAIITNSSNLHKINKTLSESIKKRNMKLTLKTNYYENRRAF